MQKPSSERVRGSWGYSRPPRAVVGIFTPSPRYFDRSARGLTNSIPNPSVGDGADKDRARFDFAAVFAETRLPSVL